jgi:hypothetical protein
MTTSTIPTQYYTASRMSLSLYHHIYIVIVIIVFFAIVLSLCTIVAMLQNKMLQTFCSAVWFLTGSVFFGDCIPVGFVPCKVAAAHKQEVTGLPLSICAKIARRLNGA